VTTTSPSVHPALLLVESSDGHIEKYHYHESQIWTFLASQTLGTLVWIEQRISKEQPKSLLAIPFLVSYSFFTEDPLG
jgi:hypothetical protein